MELNDTFLKTDNFCSKNLKVFEQSGSEGGEGGYREQTGVC
jgi:hypothetical protein